MTCASPNEREYNSLSPTASISRSLGESLRVLICDDDRLSRMHLQITLGREGMSVYETEDGQSALLQVNSQPFDIVLMDVRMPGMDGFTACEKIRALECGKDLPIVMLTGADDLASIQRALSLGATDFVTKPLRAPVLAQRIRHIVSANRGQIELSEQKAGQSALIDAIPDTILKFDHAGALTAAKFSGKMPGGIEQKAFVGASIDDIFAEVPDVSPFAAMNRAFNGHTAPIQVELGDEQASILEIRFAAGNSKEILCILRDMTEQVKQQKHIEKLSLMDPVTGLPNRSHFIQVAQRHFDSYPCTPLAVIKLCFDSLPQITNSVGATMVDSILAVIAERLSNVAERYALVPNSSSVIRIPFVARTGEHEFHVLITEAPDTTSVSEMGPEFLGAFSSPIEIDNYEFYLPVRPGSASLAASGGSIEDLLRRAGLAAQKPQHRSTEAITSYTPELEQDALRKLSMESCLRQALEHGELTLAYQPKVCSVSRTIQSMEALVRWQSSTLGNVSPAEFIPLAEETGLIIPLGEYVFERACQQSRHWQTLGFKTVPIAVNMSGHQFNQRNLEQNLLSMLSNAQLDAPAIELEITESVLMDQQERILPMLNRFRDRGVRIAIDDFGTGYSSLSMLKSLPVDILKIDRAFVSDIHSAEDSYSIVDAIIALAKALKLTLVAEGVETEEQLSYMRQRDCELIQGYLTGRPLSPDVLQAHYLS